MVSFDADWSEIYIGASRRDTFTAVCPNNVPEASNVSTTNITNTTRDFIKVIVILACKIIFLFL